MWTGFDSLLACQGSCPSRWKRHCLEVGMNPVILNILCRNSGGFLCRSIWDGTRLQPSLGLGSIPTRHSIANEVSMAARRLAMSQDRVRSTAFAPCGNNSVRTECLFYSQEAEGSNPSSRTSLKKENKMFGLVAQSGRAAALHAEGHGFESHPIHHCSTTRTSRRVMPAFWPL